MKKLFMWVGAFVLFLLLVAIFEAVPVLYKIFGWTLAVLLLGSVIYSIKFHLGNYNQAESRETEIGNNMWSTFLNRIMIMQLVKLFIAGYIISLLIK